MESIGYPMEHASRKAHGTSHGKARSINSMRWSWNIPWIVVGYPMEREASGISHEITYGVAHGYMPMGESEVYHGISWRRP